MRVACIVLLPVLLEQKITELDTSEPPHARDSFGHWMPHKPLGFTVMRRRSNRKAF